MDGEISVALSIPLFRISESGVSDDHAVDGFFLSERQRPKRFCQHIDGVSADRDLAGASLEQGAIDPDEIADVKQLNNSESVLAQMILTKVQLDPSAFVRQVREHRLPVATPRHQTTGDTDSRSL